LGDENIISYQEAEESREYITGTETGSGTKKENDTTPRYQLHPSGKGARTIQPPHQASIQPPPLLPLLSDLLLSPRLTNTLTFPVDMPHPLSMFKRKFIFLRNSKSSLSSSTRTHMRHKSRLKRRPSTRSHNIRSHLISRWLSRLWLILRLTPKPGIISNMKPLIRSVSINPGRCSLIIGEDIIDSRAGPGE